MTNYQGFQIDPQFRIFLRGKQVFTAHHQVCATEQDAKDIINLSNDQAAKQARSLPSLDRPLSHLLDEDEQRTRDEEALAEWYANQAELQREDMANG